MPSAPGSKYHATRSVSDGTPGQRLENPSVPGKVSERRLDLLFDKLATGRNPHLRQHGDLAKHRLQTLGGLSTTIVFRRSIGVAFHSTERFCAGFLSPGAGVGVGSGNAAVFVSAFVPGVTTAIDTFTEGVFESLPGAATIKGIGGITTDVASAGPAISGTSSAETVAVEPTDAAITTVGDGIDRTSEATTSDGKTATTVSAGNG